MKLATDIKPRKDGTVKVIAPFGSYVFKEGADGLMADVDNDDDVNYLLNTGNFYPDSEADVDAGVDIVQGIKRRGRKPK